MCAIIGCFNCPKAAETCYMLGHAVQHRAQEYAGCVTSDGVNLHRYAGEGIIQDVFDQSKLDHLHGKNGIMHLRYSTVEDDPESDNAQPIIFKETALAHNGNLINADRLRSGHNLKCKTRIDSEIPLKLFCQAIGETLVERVFLAVKDLRGSYCLLLMFGEHMVAVRDPWGNRPMVLGKRGDSYFISSEPVGMRKIGIEVTREVAPGEILLITKAGIQSYFFTELELSVSPLSHQLAFCIFELLYFAHPTSKIFGQHVRTFRRRAGTQLCSDCPVDADLVVPIPDSSKDHAWGFAKASGIEMDEALLRSHYIGRTFIEPFQGLRNMKVLRKFDPDEELIRGRKVVLIDDSIVRLTTLPILVDYMRWCGAKEVHARIGTPPIIDICCYGIDIPTRQELVAASKPIADIQKLCKLDSLGYLSLPGLRSLVPNPDDYCYGCMTGNYPIAA